MTAAAFPSLERHRRSRIEEPAGRENSASIDAKR